MSGNTTKLSITDSWNNTQALDSEINKQLEKIADNVATICCYGGNNKGEAHELSKIIQGMVNELIQTKLGLEAMDEGEDKKGMNAFKELSPAFAKLVNKWDTYFKSSPTMMCINPTGLELFLIALQEFEKNHIPFLVYNFSRLSSFELKHYKPIIANFTFDWVTKITSRAVYYRHRTREEIAVGEKYSCLQYQEPTSTRDRELLMLYMLNDIKGCGATFGYGNCQLMAELAFLLAIIELPPTQIRLIHFSDSQGKNEEINAIAIGDWPNAGCKILAPWVKKDKFIWKGDLKNTSELKDLDQCQVYFTVDATSQKKWQDFLKENNFSAEKLLEHTERAKFLKYIDDKSLKIFNINHVDHKAAPEPK